MALNDEQRAGEARDDARATFEHLRALLAPGRGTMAARDPSRTRSTHSASRSSRAPTGALIPQAWDAAAERFAALGEPFELGYARWRQAEALIGGGGDRAAAGAALREAAEIAAVLRAPLLTAEVEGPHGAPG